MLTSSGKFSYTWTPVRGASIEFRWSFETFWVSGFRISSFRPETPETHETETSVFPGYGTAAHQAGQNS